jgi:hypothetical protein
MIPVFCESKLVFETITAILDHSLRDLVYFNIGLVINLSLEVESRKKLYSGCLPKLIGVLRDSNIEDLDMSKVCSKALKNLCNETTISQWSNDEITNCMEVVESIIEDFDSIMVRKNYKLTGCC